jgi:hypothetical protein
MNPRQPSRPGPASWETFFRSGPFLLGVVGLLSVGMACGLGFVSEEEALTFLRVVFLISGLVLTGGAIWWRLAREGQDADERLRSSSVLILGGITCGLGYVWGLATAWDSLRMALLVFTCVLFLGSLLALLPPLGRRVSVSLLIVLHFGGILTATLTVPAPGQAGPYVPTAAWNLIYRHYLQFTYMNNAYHFYSPEPGPPTLLWFRIEYDGPVQPYWYKLLVRKQFPTRLQYQRLLALTEHANQPGPVLPNAKLTRLYERRAAGGVALGLPPLVPADAGVSYRQLPEMSELYVSSYIRHVARTIRHPERPELKVKRIRLYRLNHLIINAAQLAAGANPLDKSFYQVFYLGEFDPEGKMVYDGWMEKELLKQWNKPAARKYKWTLDDENQVERWLTNWQVSKHITWTEIERGKIVTKSEPLRDPFLYWNLPVVGATDAFAAHVGAEPWETK